MTTTCWTKVHLTHTHVAQREKTPDTTPSSTTPCPRKSRMELGTAVFQDSTRSPVPVLRETHFAKLVTDQVEGGPSLDAPACKTSDEDSKLCEMTPQVFCNFAALEADLGTFFLVQCNRYCKELWLRNGLRITISCGYCVLIFRSHSPPSPDP